MQTDVTSTDLPTTPVVVFGLDDRGKAHASRFGSTDASVAERAAGLMRMRVLRLSTPEEAALAEGVAAGRVFASGRGFVPFCSRARYDRLAAAPAAFAPEPPADMPAKAPAKAKGGRKASAAAPAGGEPVSKPERPGMPAADWPAITVGCLALAAEEGKPQYWYPAIVTGDRGEDLLELRWLEDEDGELPLIVRRREHLGLYPPGLIEALV